MPGPLEVTYDYAAIKKVISRSDRIAAAVACGATSSCCRRIAKDRVQLGLYTAREGRASRDGTRVSELYIKDDSVNHPTFSYKDRVVSIAATRNVELGFPCVWVRVHRQPRKQRVGARGAPRVAVLRLHSERSGAKQDPRSAVYGPQIVRRRRQLR
jgi:threonine synthase